MINKITLCFTLILCTFNLSYSQSYECDNNYGDCGTPNQSGGGGGGGGSILIANTDLGDTYQSADDFDDDGIEDPSDNCMRVSNPDQIDRDGDGIGDVCDNCLDTWNQYQSDLDGDGLGDVCDEDDDNDGLLDVDDSCPRVFGEDFCEEEYSLNYDNNFSNDNSLYNPVEYGIYNNKDLDYNSKANNCRSTNNIAPLSINILLVLFIISVIRKFRKTQI